MPRINISATDAERDRLEQLAKLLGGVPLSRAIALAAAHTLATLRAGLPLRLEEIEPPREGDGE